MQSKKPDALQPELDRANEKLAAALSEACQVDVKRANTGELIRVEEVLAIANEAAKTAVSIRRRRSPHRNEVASDAPPFESNRPTPDAERARPAAAPDEESQVGHRVFRDSAGVRWEAFAVHPSADSQGRARLPEPYRTGWLAFESDQDKRRLSPIPNGWQSLPVAGLLELCERAERVRRRTNPGERHPTDG